MNENHDHDWVNSTYDGGRHCSTCHEFEFWETDEEISASVVQRFTTIEIDGVTVTVWRSEGSDGCLVVQVDTTTDEQADALRFNINDAHVYGPGLGEVPDEEI